MTIFPGLLLSKEELAPHCAVFPSTTIAVSCLIQAQGEEKKESKLSSIIDQGDQFGDFRESLKNGQQFDITIINFQNSSVNLFCLLKQRLDI